MLHLIFWIAIRRV